MRDSFKLRFAFVIGWIGVTVAVAVWWLIFGLRQSERLLTLRSETALELARHQRMLASEGAILIALVVAGGLFLLYYMVRERRHYEQVKEFFAIYTHDLKTSLASLRLQAETLQEDLHGSSQARIVGRLVKDTVRLELQLENSLFIANPDAKLFLETLRLRKTLMSFRDHWPEVEVRVTKDCDVDADARAFESVLKNLIQNSVAHGEASQIDLVASQVDRDHVRIEVKDNGRGFDGKKEELGQLFKRHTSRSGSGVGLYLADSLLAKMGGRLRLPSSDSGFAVDLILRGQVH